MGTVYLATHLVIGQKVALKLVSGGGADRAYVGARFLREARTAALLQSEHVVRVLDADESEDGSPFMVMEYLQGSDLGALLQREGRMPVARAVADVLQICEALAEAHALGIVHRDLKPSNIFRAETSRAEPVVKLLDFGISKVPTSEHLALTDAQAVIGSPLFMSPEQLLSSKDVDNRTDVWSLGVTLYQLVSGSLPFEASNASSLGAQIAATLPVPLSRAFPSAPEALEQAVMRCLARAPEDRFPDVVALARALAPLAGDAGPGALAVVERALDRGARARSSAVFDSDPGPAPPPAMEASGERWTRSHDVAPAPAETSRDLVIHGGGQDVDPALDTRSAHRFVSEQIVAAPPPRPRPRRRAMRFVLAAVVVVLAASVVRLAVRSRAPQPIHAATSAALPPPVAASTPPLPPAISPSDLPVAAVRSASPPARAGKTGPKPASTWSKDPAELELK